VHLEYFHAGADVATAATYQATFDGFRRHGIEPEAAAQLMQAAVTLAVEAREEFWSSPANRLGRRRPLVAASIGPYGAMLADGSEYRGNYAVGDGELRDFHRSRMRVLADSGADLLGCETFPGLREALIVAGLLEEFPALSAWISFSCRDDRRDCEGDDVGECAEALDRFAQVAAVGVNCSPPRVVAPVLRRMRARTRKPLIAYPNSGERYDAGAKTWHGHGMSFAGSAQTWFASGARIIGGCCRTTPDDIRAIRACFGGRLPGPQ